MNIRATHLAILGIAIFLSGCSTIEHSNLLRNRSYDYVREPVSNCATPLQTPAGLATPQFTPLLAIPSGVNDYPPEKSANITPPDFNEVIPVPALPDSNS